MDEVQAHHLDRATARIGPAIASFCAARVGQEFHADDLRRFVRESVGETAPGSADRVLRDLRQRGLVGYTLVSRGKSLYRSEFATAQEAA